jgi:hypothetical protein
MLTSESIDSFRIDLKRRSECPLPEIHRFPSRSPLVFSITKCKENELKDLPFFVKGNMMSLSKN